MAFLFLKKVKDNRWMQRMNSQSEPTPYDWNTTQVEGPILMMQRVMKKHHHQITCHFDMLPLKNTDLTWATTLTYNEKESLGCSGGQWHRQRCALQSTGKATCWCWRSTMSQFSLCLGGCTTHIFQQTCSGNKHFWISSSTVPLQSASCTNSKQQE